MRTKVGAAGRGLALVTAVAVLAASPVAQPPQSAEAAPAELRADGPPFWTRQGHFLDAPHASYPVDDRHDRRILRSRDQGRTGFWASLRPSWLDRSYDPLHAGALEHFLEDLARGLQWGPGTTARVARELRSRPVSFSYRLTAGERVLAEGVDQTEPGVVRVISDVTSHLVVHELRDQIAQAIAIRKPETALSFAGTSLALQLLPVPGLGWQAEVALVRTEHPESERLDLGLGFGAKTRERVRLGELGATVVCARGRPASLRTPGPSGTTLSLELEVLGEDPPETTRAGAEVVCVAAPTVVRAGRDAGEWNVDYASDYGYAAFEGPTAAGRAASLVHAAQGATATTPLELTVRLDGPDGTAPPVTLAIDAVEGLPVRFASGEIAAVVRSWYVHVAQGARAAHPSFERPFSGVRGTVTVRAGKDGERAVELYLEATRLRLGDPLPARLADEEPPRAFADRQWGGFPAVDVLIDQPALSQQSVVGTFTPDADGRFTVRRSWPEGELGSLTVDVRVGE